VEEPSQPSCCDFSSSLFTTIVLRHVHDVALTLVPRWPPCTLYQSREDDVGCVVRSIAKRSLFDGALADICTSAGPSPTSLCLLAGSQCVTRPPGYGYSVFADARLVHALSDQWKLHSMSGLPRLVWSVQHVKTLRSCRHWRPTTSRNLRVSSIYATERRCKQGLDAFERATSVGCGRHYLRALLSS
jgi:hypothetical protein